VSTERRTGNSLRRAVNLMVWRERCMGPGAGDDAGEVGGEQGETKS
jgi:hypothetical protein